MSHDFMRAIIENPADDGPRLVYADYLEEQGDPRAEFIRLQCQLPTIPEWLDDHCKGCETCQGTGNCPDCDGAGELAGDYFADDGMSTCERCRGRGTCDDCGGPKRNAARSTLLARQHELLDSFAFRWFGPAQQVFSRYSLGQNGTSIICGKYPPGVRLDARRGFVDEVLCSCQEWADRGRYIVAIQPVIVARLHWRPAAGPRWPSSPWPWPWAQPISGDVHHAAVTWAREKAGLSPIKWPDDVSSLL